MKGFTSLKFLLLNFALFSTILARNLNPRSKLIPNSKDQAKVNVNTTSVNVRNCPNGSICMERGKCEEKFVQKDNKGEIITCSDDKVCCHNSTTIAERNRRNFSPTVSTPAAYYHHQYQSPKSSQNHGYSDYESYEDPTEMYVENDDQFDDYPGEESYYSNSPMNYEKTEGVYSSSSTQNVDQNPQQQTECTPPREENAEPSITPTVDYSYDDPEYYNPEVVEEIETDEGSGYEQDQENLGYDQYTDRPSNFNQNYYSETTTDSETDSDGYPGQNEESPTEDASDYEPKSTSESGDKPGITSFRVPIRHIHSYPKKLKKYPIKKHMMYTSNKYDKRYNSIGRKLYNKNVNLYSTNINQNQQPYVNTNKYTGTSGIQNQNSHPISNPSQSQIQTSPNLNLNVPVPNPQLQSNNGHIVNQYSHQQQQQVYQEPQQLQQQQHQRYQRKS